MDWKKELEALLQESQALVYRTGSARRVLQPTPAAAQSEAVHVVETVPPAPEPKALPGLVLPTSSGKSDRAYIIERVANFKAHQARMTQDREDYCSRTLQWTLDVANGRLVDRRP